MSETPATKKWRGVQFPIDLSSTSGEDDLLSDTHGLSAPRKTPTAVSRAVVAKAVASHPDSIKDLTILKSTAFTALKNKLRQQTQTRATLSEDSFIPTSTRLNFKLTASESVLETESFKTLNTSMEAFTAAWKKAAKKTICSVVDLEIENTKKEITKIFVITAKQLGKLLLLQEDPESKIDETQLVAVALLTHGCALTKHLDNTRARVMHKLYEPALFIETALTIEIQEEVSPFVQKLVDLLTVAFVDSWDAQLNVHRNQAIDRAMTKQSRIFLDGDATEQAAAAMDTEPSADPALLKDFIRREMNNQQKKFQQDLNSIKQLVARTAQITIASPKNKQRGATKQQKQKGASAKKKSSPGKAKKPPATKPRSILKNGASAGQPGNATQQGKAQIKLTKKVNSRAGNSQNTKNKKKPPPSK